MIDFNIGNRIREECKVDRHTATELAYKNGYESGKKEALSGTMVELVDYLLGKLCDSKCNECIMNNNNGECRLEIFVTERIGKNEH